MDEQPAVTQALVTIRKLQAQLEAERAARAEPIAIIGMGCRLPGGVDDPEGFWRLLDERVDAVTEVPADRWAAGADTDQRATRWGAFLEGVDRFDADFFGISRREANAMDPQQRLLLEVAWEALERAGQPPRSLSGSPTGVFLGVVVTDYAALSAAGPPRDIYTVTGNGHSFPAGRLSYVLGLQGPSMVVDTACSSSLVAIHLACRSLRDRECTLALAGGVNLMLEPSMTAMMAGAQALSPDGRCATFDAQASGYVRGEGCGVIVLKRLSDALAAGDPVLALVRGSAVNQDGRSAGLTAPNVAAQQDMLRQALRSARVGPADISYVETHGTGTPLGDPIEVSALADVIGAPRADASECVLGAVKTNIGHLEAAAGVAGVIKVVLAIRRERIPANLHLQTQNPRIALDGTCFRLAAEPVPWPRDADRPRLAGVSSFGISGTNAHVILAEPPPEPAAAEPSGDELRETDGAPVIVPLSARTGPALQALAASYRAALGSRWRNGPRLADIASTAATRRDHHERRAALVVESHEHLGRLLDAYLDGAAAPGLITASRRVTEPPRIVFVFPGQGSQWPGMGRELLASEPVFRAAIEQCDAAIGREAGWSPVAELAADADPTRLERTDVVQPMLFAIGTALAALWRSRGVEPDAVVGHSMGEIAAAHAAGALSLPDAVRIVCRRAALLHELRGRGAMAVVELSMDEAEEALGPYADRLSVAASNSARSTVVSGDPGPLADVLAELSSRDVYCRRIRVDVASHSPHVDPLHDELIEALRDIAPRPAGVRMYSTVTTRACQGAELDASYWARNLRAPVLFGPVIEQLLQDGDALFVELSPHPILVPAIADALAESGSAGVAVASMHRGRPARQVHLESLGALYVHGADVDWQREFPRGGRCAPLPTYPWQRERYWLDAVRPASGARDRRPDPAGHPLLGTLLPVASQPDVHVWESALAAAPSYLSDHRVAADAVLPAAACIEMALAAAHRAGGDGPAAIDHMAFDRMIVLPEQGDRVLQLAVEDGEDGRPFRLFSREGDGSTWVLHVAGTVSRETPAGRPPPEPLDVIRDRCGLERAAAELYERFGARGMHYGPAFRAVERCWTGAGEVLGRVRLPERLAGSGREYRIHPVLLDAALQVLGGLALAERPGEDVPLVPVAVRRLRVHARPGEHAWVHGRLRDPDGPGDAAVGDLRLLDDGGRVLAELDGVRMRSLTGAVPERAERWLHAVDWRPAPAPEVPAGPAPGTWIVLADGTGCATALASALRARGARCVTVDRGSRYRRHDPSRYEIDLADEAAWEELLRDVHAERAPCRGLVNLWSLDTTATAGTDADTLGADAQLTTLAALPLARAMSRAASRDTPRLFLVTRGAQAAGPAAPVAVSQTPLWGFARTLAMEHPELRCKRIDLSPDAQPGDAGPALVDEILGTDREDEVALRPGNRYVARLARASFPASGGAASLRGDRTYLITGGLGGLGLRLAEWMVDRGARHLVLASRNGATASMEATLQRLRPAGAEVVAMAADVSRRAELAGLLGDIDALMPPLAGVVHAAMVLDDRTVSQLDADRFMRVFAPKAQGAWNLHALTLGHPLELFVLYSSAAALLGSPGQANYAAANAFLGALAHHRRAEGLPAVCVDWGLFSEAGIMATREAAGERLGFRGVGALTPAQGMAALDRLLADPPAQIGVFDLDVRQWLEFYPAAAQSRLLSELEPAGDATGEDHALRTALDAAAPDRRVTLLADLVAEQLARTLHVDPSRIDRSATFGALGLDSLMGLELRNRLEARLGARLSVSVLFASPTVSSVAAHLDGEMTPGGADPAPAPTDPDVDALSTDEVLRLIDSTVAGTAGGPAVGEVGT